MKTTFIPIIFITSAAFAGAQGLTPGWADAQSDGGGTFVGIPGSSWTEVGTMITQTTIATFFDDAAFAPALTIAERSSGFLNTGNNGVLLSEFTATNALFDKVSIYGLFTGIEFDQPFSILSSNGLLSQSGNILLGDGAIGNDLSGRGTIIFDNPVSSFR